MSVANRRWLSSEYEVNLIEPGGSCGFNVPRTDGWLPFGLPLIFRAETVGAAVHSRLLRFTCSHAFWCSPGRNSSGWVSTTWRRGHSSWVTRLRCGNRLSVQTLVSLEEATGRAALVSRETTTSSRCRVLVDSYACVLNEHVGTPSVRDGD